jgi:KDO2-lipid IV(A) lauroyltransferase
VDKSDGLAFQRAFLHPRYWKTWASLALLWSIAQLPVRANQALGRGLGHLLYRVAKSRRRVAERNIELCFPEYSPQKRAETVKGVVLGCGMSITESAMALWGSDKKLRDRYTLEGLEHIEKAQAQGKGVLLAGCHFTTIDISGRIMSFHISADVVYREDNNPVMSWAIARARARVNNDAIHRHDMRKLIRNLRKGHIVWYAPDQDYGKHRSIFAPFFGIEAATVPGTSKLARLTDCAVIPFAHYREEGGRYRLVVHPPLENFPTDDERADATQVNAKIEEMIRVEPAEYMWVHRRFKSRPDGEPSLY